MVPAQRWGVRMGGVITHVAMTAQGAELFVGQQSQLLLHNIDATLSVATRAGGSRTLRIAGGEPDDRRAGGGAGWLGLDLPQQRRG